MVLMKNRRVAKYFVKRDLTRLASPVYFPITQVSLYHSIIICIPQTKVNNSHVADIWCTFPLYITPVVSTIRVLQSAARNALRMT